ncbi:MAG: ATP-binding protein [Bacteroidales bacterium]|nr:ATP-binding protein [Bacteroidales bacterium]
MINRIIEKQIRESFFRDKAIIIVGPRQSGKTTLVNKILEDCSSESLFLDADDPNVEKLLTRPNTMQIKNIIGNKTIVFIDEAQRIKDIGITSKIIVDQFKKVQLILSGSSAFDLAQRTNEPLTGRKRSFNLFPISWAEWQNHIGFVKAEQDIENRLVYGFYPDILNSKKEANIYLRELAESYLYKDILMYGDVKKPDVLKRLLQALAFQIGNEVSLRELGEIVGLDPKTVDRYISILEKAYVVFRLPALSRNLRNEIKTNRKIYFYDNGIRNAVIAQLQALPLRQDIGQLWENFIISERLKQLNYNNLFANTYFWRTTQQQEIDYIEEIDGKFFAYEIKWNPKRKVNFPKTFTDSYKAKFSTINRENFQDFLIK